MRKAAVNGKVQSRFQRIHRIWPNLRDHELLQMRICDLGVGIRRTPLEKRIDQLYEELARRGIRCRPHCWLSDEWFSPDGIPGIAIPFYLAHPRLMRLEEKQMLEVEGGTKEWCMRILRHEAGHAIDTAYRLHRRRSWQNVFGSFTQPYPDYYHPRPHSKRYVHHLDYWYAQSHPIEDFAETFAVWLKPRSAWRTHYQGWPALKKLQFVDRLMGDLHNRKPQIISRQHVEPVRRIRKTLGDNYREKRSRYEIDLPDFYDDELRRMFSESPRHTKCPSAAAFLRRNRPELRKMVAHWTGEYQYTIDQVLSEMIECCRKLNLHLDRPDGEAKRDMLVMLTVQTMNYLHGRRHRVTI